MRAIVRAIDTGYLVGTANIVISNNGSSPALEFAAQRQMPALCINRTLVGTDEIVDRAIAHELLAHDVNLVVLSGYMRKIGPRVLSAFRNRILNIHPALLPRFGGRSMYGLRVHQAVVAAGEQSSGVTIHMVDELYDHGPIVLQKRMPVEPGDTPESLGDRIGRAEPGTFVECLRAIQDGRLNLPDSA